MHGSLLGVGTALYVSGDVFEHHNCVVDHHTDGDRQRRERNDVKRVACGKEVDKRSDKRDRDGDDDDNGSTPTTEECKHHDNHEEQCIEHGLGE